MPGSDPFPPQKRNLNRVQIPPDKNSGINLKSNSPPCNAGLLPQQDVRLQFFQLLSHNKGQKAYAFRSKLLQTDKSNRINEIKKLRTFKIIHAKSTSSNKYFASLRIS